MRAINIQAIANKYASFLDAGTAYHEVLAQAVKALKGASCPELLEALAKVHAKKYQCNYTWNSNGGAVFHTGAKSTRDTRHDAAARSWQRNVACHFSNGATRVAPNKSVDPVAKLLKAYAGLTAAQKRSFLSRI